MAQTGSVCDGDADAEMHARGIDPSHLQRLYQAALTHEDARSTDAVTFALARHLSLRQPVFAFPGLSLTSWELRVDRGVGMLLRPPSRILGDAGLDAAFIRSMPIRLNLGGGMMAGAYVPSRLIPELRNQLDDRMSRSLKRMLDAEMDAIQMMAVMVEAVRFAERSSLGLLESIGLLDASDMTSWPVGVTVISRSTNAALLDRIKSLSVPPKKPGLLTRIFGGKRQC
jgi:hypothetical protein